MWVEKININLIDESDYEYEHSLMTEAKRREISGYREKDLKLSTAGRILLRKGISQLYGIKDYDISYNQNGKPLLDFCFFSISHSGDYAMCAISDREIGVDIQKISEIKMRSSYMLLSEQESEYINSSYNPKLEFHTIWTMKEAFVKANGGALSQAAEINLVTGQNRKAKFYENFNFKTEFFENYVFTVCEKAR